MAVSAVGQNSCCCKRTMRNLIKKCESGLTLVEMLTAVSVIIIMGGASYAVFNTAIDTYHLAESKLIQAQRVRFALDHISTDLSQIQADTSDEMLAIFSQDSPTAAGDTDILSFVTLIRTDPELFAEQARLRRDATLIPSLSDVRRVVYYVGQEIPIEMRQNASYIPPPYTASQVTEQSASAPDSLTLYRIVTTALDPELVVDAFMNSGAIPQVDESGAPIHFEVTPIIDGIVNFDLKYYDEEAPYDMWEQRDVIPLIVQIFISVIDEEARQTAQTQTFVQTPGEIPPEALTQSVMVHLPSGANAE